MVSRVESDQVTGFNNSIFIIVLHLIFMQRGMPQNLPRLTKKVLQYTDLLILKSNNLL